MYVHCRQISKFSCTIFRIMKKSEHLASFSFLFQGEYKSILYLPTMYLYCVYIAMSCMQTMLNTHKKARNVGLFDCISYWVSTTRSVSIALRSTQGKGHHET